MPSESDELDKALRENLKLRHELAAKANTAKDGSASHRVSRGLHRLALFLAATALLAGSASSFAERVPSKAPHHGAV
jgi:hypothetical protein